MTNPPSPNENAPVSGADERAMRVVAYLPAKHKVSCARHDPDSGPCDCGAQRTPLVTLADAQRAVAEARQPATAAKDTA